MPHFHDGYEAYNRHVEGLKIQLEEAKIEKRHKEECEAIRRLIAAQPPQQRLNDFEKEVGG